jgi:NAD+ kinase
MKLMIYSKQSLTDNPVKLQLSKDLLNRGHSLIETTEISGQEDCDCILVFGGDGTMLYAATKAQRPILGINLGNVGFLTQFESNVSSETIEHAINSGATFERHLVETAVSNQNLVALNEIAIKTASARPMTLSVYVDGQFVDKYHADGIIVSTPTGSTAYSLSAGGPVLDPDMDALVINPICPHSLHSRTLVVKGDSEIEVKVHGGQGVVYADASEQTSLGGQESVIIKKSSKKAVFVGDYKTDFYKKLLEKMNRWGITC